MAGRLADGRARHVLGAGHGGVHGGLRGRRDAGFELQTRQLPELQGRDGRWDMPHMWLYPLRVGALRLGGPARRRSRPLGTRRLERLRWSPGCCGWRRRRGAGPWTLTLFASPHRLVARQAARRPVHRRPARRGDAAVARVRTGQPRAARYRRCAEPGPAGGLRHLRPLRDRTGSKPLHLETLADRCRALAPRARPSRRSITCARLDRLSPLTSFTAASWPSLTTLFFPLADVNMGVLVRCPPDRRSS